MIPDIKLGSNENPVVTSQPQSPVSPSICCRSKLLCWWGEHQLSCGQGSRLPKIRSWPSAWAAWTLAGRRREKAGVGIRITSCRAPPDGSSPADLAYLPQCVWVIPSPPPADGWEPWAAELLLLAQPGQCSRLQSVKVRGESRLCHSKGCRVQHSWEKACVCKPTVVSHLECYRWAHFRLELKNMEEQYTWLACTTTTVCIRPYSLESGGIMAIRLFH